ncbi:MAG TPA: SET domain-containing protein-lysine N-methyltransferase [Gemmatimonadota bacterium]|nr:SET domain-containing protein-lysine N-methyltransferase [Gemmatimonadota bacterium]
MRVCLLTDAYAGSASPLKEVDLPCDPRPWLPGAEWTWVELDKATAVPRVMDLTHDGYDVFFNLCDGSWDEDRPGIEVVQALERLEQAYTGATPEFYDPSREAMKRVCHAWGIDTPGYVVAAADPDVERAADTLRFPLIVKHPNSYSSLGMTRESRVETAAALREQFTRMREAYGGALIEEFVEGRECTVLVAENPDDARRPLTYTPVEWIFPPGETFQHFDVKWHDWWMVPGKPVEDPDLDARLREDSARFFRGLRGTGFARTDVRVDADGRAWMLEINPNCGIYYPESAPSGADLALMFDPAGYEGFTERLVTAAIRRRDRRRRPWSVRHGRDNGYGIHARRAIHEGERILAYEATPHRLVTRSRVERDWGEPDATWFRSYGWPLTDEVWVVWSHDPEEWRPINHSCDPNAWLDGLDVVARRPIEPDEEITMDYATFCNELMPCFECACGAPGCRRTITGEDHLADFVARYGDHVSDYVRRKRQEAGVVG